MKDFLAVVLSFSMLTASCGIPRYKAYDHKPVKSMSEKESRTAKTTVNEELKNYEQTLPESDPQTSAAVKSKNGLSTAVVNAAMNALVENERAFITDLEGNSATVADYELAPANHFIALKTNDQDENYKVLRTVLNSDQPGVNKMIEIGYSLFDYTGSVDDFTPSQMSEATKERTLKLGTLAGDLLKNRKNIDILIDGMTSDESHASLSPANALESVVGFLFPTAYADHNRYERSLLITAIVFSSVAVVSYVIGRYTLGHIAVLGGVVFWLLYAFERNRDETPFWHDWI